MEVYRLFWDEFSSWYLEMVKPAYQAPIDAATYRATLGFFDDLLHLLHPFMPFITEELWQHLAERRPGESIMVSPQTIEAPHSGDEALIAQFETVKGVVAGVRGARAQKNISPREVLSLTVVGKNEISAYDALVAKMASLSEIKVADEVSGAGYSTFLVGTTQYALYLGDVVDLEAEKEAAKAELEHLRKFLKSIQGKLSNERFVNNAPEAVVALERKKEADTLTKIAGSHTLTVCSSKIDASLSDRCVNRLTSSYPIIESARFAHRAMRALFCYPEDCSYDIYPYSHLQRRLLAFGGRCAKAVRGIAGTIRRKRV